MQSKTIINFVQSVLDEHNGFINIKTLPQLMTKQMRMMLRLQINSTAILIRETIEPLIGDKFIFHKKGSRVYIMTPCELSDLVLAMIANRKPTSPSNLSRLTPLTKKEMQKVINYLVEENRVKISFNEFLEPRVILLNNSENPAPKIPEKEDYTLEKFKAAFDELDNGKIFVRICDLRKKLSWPREVFDEALKILRDQEIIQLHTGDASLMTPQEIQDSFIDENNFRLGTVTWYAR